MINADRWQQIRILEESLGEKKQSKKKTTDDFLVATWNLRF